ncbi:MAG: autoinducer binding domain-containing protein [Roseibium sp.]|uniref:helix-turn-helix transcriptional regulator n=1 Tax=Roseibium sp. TaxID=1936156 RepID=UPI001B08D2DE|nr:helix-turn-helix transcriptional regulator [Roseibium sp.]MBO6894896.1 autoinducer binding domain-containing protein [Roseibium sp.]MBO6930299.1 autoinducer binding domain-containing protein [Roseibium sp.]
MDSERIASAISLLEENDTAHGVIQAFVSIIDPYGFQGFVAADYDVSDRWKLLLYTSMPAFFGPLDEESPWWSDDPAVAELATGTNRPFRIEDAWANPLPSAAPRWNYIVEQGYGRGWVFPTSKPGYVGGVHLISRLDEAEIAQQINYLGELQLLATYCHAFVTERDPDADDKGIVRNTLGMRPYDGRKAKLAPREVNCLRWCAFGKTAEEIGIIEGISVHTARDYLRSAMSKLDSRSQAQAVARGLKYGLFSI